MVGLDACLAGLELVVRVKKIIIREAGNGCPSPDYSGRIAMEVVWLPTWVLQRLWDTFLL